MKSVKHWRLKDETCDLLEDKKVIITGNLYLFKARKLTKFTFPKLVKVTSNLLDFDINPETLFHD